MAKTLSRIKKVDITTVIDSDDGIEEKTITIKVKKAPLGKWKQLTDNVKVLFDLLPEVLEEKGIENPQEYMMQMSEKEIISYLPDMFRVATDEVIDILSLGAGVDVETLENEVGIDEAVELFEAVVEVNNLVKVVEKGKNLMKLLKNIKN
ncbi:hypothetical protein [Halanaerobium salsuginis]|uniref:Tail assembly chaperone n=1 Tax=Halanaerobium salsuginis TaxID=29563 RepID=A0A1I4LS23_9FIRM|nr:hypothetical protein [Halanaerobium salsuginis]SFL93725.1 hypothetical protein SAMN02983006_02392 [Halanaerobium salsuginis]